MSFCFEYHICFFEPAFLGKDLQWFWQDAKLSLKSRIICEIWQTNSILKECNCPRIQLYLVNKNWKLLPVFQCPLLLQVIVFCFCYSFLQSAAQCMASQWTEVTNGVWDLVLEKELSNKKTKPSNSIKSFMLVKTEAKCTQWQKDLMTLKD